MKVLYCIFAVLVLLVGCASHKEKTFLFSRISIDTLLSEKISVRAIAFDDSGLWFGADAGRFGYIRFNGKTSGIRKADTISSEFRSIAVTKDAVFLLNAGSPATLYCLPKKGSQLPDRMYIETGKDVFYDSMQFFNEKDGIAMGDPMNGCFSVIRTTDGGQTWTKSECSTLPPVEQGEAAFAASNTCLVVNGNNVWMVSGGKKARVFHSPDKGKSWEVSETPLMQGEAMTGIFSGDFYDSRNGFVAGGNYEKPQLNYGNKAVTSDGGKTWALVGEGQGPGYVSCVQYAPGSNGNALVTVGATGMHFSGDQGKTWKQLSTDPDFYTIRFTSPTVAYAAGRNKIVKLRFY